MSRQAHSAKATKLALQRPQLQLEHPLAIESAADSSWLHNTHVRMSGGFIVFMPYNRLFEAATRVTLQQYADLGDDIIDETVTEVPLYANVHGYWPIVHGNAACPNLWDLKLKLYAGSSTFPAWSKLGCTWAAPEWGEKTAYIAGRKRNLRQANLRQHPIARNPDSSCCSTQRPGIISFRRKHFFLNSDQFQWEQAIHAQAGQQLLRHGGSARNKEWILSNAREEANMRISQRQQLLP